MADVVEAEPVGAVAASTVSERRPRVPAPLAALLAVTLILGLAWALILPAWQAPDENSHYGYVQSLVDGPGLPGVAGHSSLSSEQGFASVSSNADQTAAARTVRPEWDARAYKAWQRAQAKVTAAQRSDGGGANAARSNPPLAYLLYAMPYELAKSAGPFDRLEYMRIFGLLWLLVTVAATWALAGEVFGDHPSLQLTAAAVPALTPMVTFVSASVSPDGLMFATWTLALWLGARMLRRGLTLANGVAFMAAVGAACWVKATSYALLPGALLALGIGLWRLRTLGTARMARLGVPALATLFAIVGGWVVAARVLARPASEQLTSAATASGLDVRELGSYVWQFYLPRLWFMQDFFPSLQISWPVYDVVLKGAWGRFGWLEVVFPEPVYWLLTAVTLVGCVGALVSLWRARARLDRGMLAFFALVMLTLLAGLHWQEYRFIVTATGPFMQGRYVLPLVGLAGLVAAAAMRLVPLRLRLRVTAGVVGGMFMLEVFALALTVERFYA